MKLEDRFEISLGLYQEYADMGRSIFGFRNGDLKLFDIIERVDKMVSEIKKIVGEDSIKYKYKLCYKRSGDDDSPTFEVEVFGAVILDSGEKIICFREISYWVGYMPDVGDIKFLLEDEFKKRFVNYKPERKE